MLQQHQIKDIIDQIASAYQPDKIYLFGSYALGCASDDSDLDLFIIKNTDKRKIERNREVRRCIKNYPVTGLDIIVYTPIELSDSLKQTVNIGKEAIASGKLMYERV